VVELECHRGGTGVSPWWHKTTVLVKYSKIYWYAWEICVAVWKVILNFAPNINL